MERGDHRPIGDRLEIRRKIPVLYTMCSVKFELHLTFYEEGKNHSWVVVSHKPDDVACIVHPIDKSSVGRCMMASNECTNDARATMWSDPVSTEPNQDEISRQENRLYELLLTGRYILVNIFLQNVTECRIYYLDQIIKII